MTTRYWWLALTLTAVAPCGAATLPAAASRLLPSGQTVIGLAEADLSGDGRPDYVVALRAATEDARKADGAPAPARTLLVVMATADGGFAIAGRNTRVIFKADEGGQCDPFLDGEDGLVAKGAYFTVQNGVACGQHWTDYITFRYDRASGGVFFHKRVLEGWEMNSDDSPDVDALRMSEHKEIKADPRKPIALSAYNPAVE
ncbi:hypothetical protein [Xanthomonas euroxanthea]|uniref:VCBS repeat-containing protein n=1 Tax=Xanthomonas euroxanthea TaxID=2259622 RepID=A0AA46HB61_9XANT|nr:hypothetical protein [Xanthomonas euroxanthea]CAE1137013.1 hypothetical protein XTG_002531 [Xanthomonas euroxanthea]SUZ29038.1 hypothetical protein CPBF424_28690 [Xanthomonas euroxanthea]